MSNQPPHKSSPSKSQPRDKGGPQTGPRFRKNTGGNSSKRNLSANTNNPDNDDAGANNAGNAGVISVHGSPIPQHQNPHQHVQQVHQHARTQSPRAPHAPAPPPRMVQSASTSSHSSNIIYAHSPNLVHPHAHAAVSPAYSPQPGHPPNIPHSSHSPHPNHSPHPVHPGHSPTLSRAGHSPTPHPHSQHFHGHSPSLYASPHFPPARTPTFSHTHHVYPSPSPRPRPMSMHAGMGMSMRSMPGTSAMGYGMAGGMNMALNIGVNMGMGVVAYDGPVMHMNTPDLGSPGVHASNTNNAVGAGAHHDPSAAFNLCRRRVVGPGIEGQSSTFAASVDPELAGVAVRVANPRPLLLPNGFLWEFEIPRGMVPASLTDAILNVTQTAIPLLVESRPADACARGEHTARIYMPQQCLETHPGWEEKRAEWIAERAELHAWHGRIPDVAGSHISLSNRTGKPMALWVCKSRFPDLSQRSEREVLVIARTAVQGGSEDWAQMVCRRAMPPARTLLPHGEAQLKMWILRALSILVLQGVEVVEWSYEFLIPEQQFWWVYRGQSQSGGDPDLSELDRGEPIPDSM
ncbi:hypothetical protein FS749_010219 [Ceratobasidium sp. UAMH 11750]|nr:hypothetical protein FS749_010219 [Ceratobasidium sp. UAMH 11750]